MILSIPYCGMAPLPSELIQRWNMDPLLLIGLGGLAVFWMLRRPFLEPLSFWSGWLVLVICFVSPLCALTTALFSARSAHHLLLICLAAPLLARALPARLPVSLSVVTFLKGGILVLWHVPAVYEASLSNDIVYWLLQAGLLLSAVMFWSRVWDASAPRAFAALAGIMTLMGLIGAVLTFAPLPLYAAHLTTTWTWGVSPLEDQQLSGLVMWALSLPVYVLAAALIAGRLVSGGRHEALA
ncbi:MAG: cytochrome c oxidase assembly protein [Hyphomonas sp.]